MKYENNQLSQLKTWKDRDTSSLSPDFLSAIAGQLEEKCRRTPTPFSFFLKTQIRFIGWRIWAGQAILLLVALLAFGGILKDSGIRFALLMPHILFYLSLLVSGVILPVLYRSFRYQMQEIETTTYYATPRILLAKLIVVGIGDLAILGSLGAVTAIRSSLSVGCSVLYLLCPFLLASVGIMYLIHHFPGKFLLIGSAGVYALLILGYRMLRQHYPAALEAESGILWGLLCLILLVVYSFQLIGIEKSSGFEELQLV